MNRLYWMISIVLMLMETCVCQFSTSLQSFNVVPSRPKEVLPINSYQKDHLVVVMSVFLPSVKTMRNSTGHLIRVEGVSPLILDWLSLRYKFDYSILDTNVSLLDDMGPKRPGLISYLLRGESQVMLAFMGPSPDRLRKVEVVHPWLYTPPAFLIPMPEILPNNVDAVIKPFQLWVWMGLVGAVASFIFTMSYLNRILTSRMNQCASNNEGNVDPSPVVTESVYMYVVGTLLNQGGSISCQINSVRLVVGAWCLMTLVLVNVYNGILISYVTAIHRAPPIATSELDIAFDPNIRLVVDKGQSGDLWFSTAQKGIFKGYGDKLRSYPNSRCNSSHECVDLVKSLPPQHVYFSVMMNLKDIIKADYKSTGQCKLTITAPASNHPGTWGLEKKSPYLERFNRGTLMLHEAGLITLWREKVESNTKPCYSEKNANYIDDQDSKKKPLARLSLTNLAGAFAILAAGCLLSIVAFGIEILVFNKRRTMPIKREPSSSRP